MLQWAPLRANMNDYRVVPSMKQGSYSYAPSIKKEKGAPFGNSQLSNTVIKGVGPLVGAVPLVTPLLRDRELFTETP